MIKIIIYIITTYLKYIYDKSMCLLSVYWISFMTSVGNYSQLSSCRHPAIRDTLIIWTAAKSQEKMRSTEVNFRYYRLSLMRTLTQGPCSVCHKGS